MKPDLVIVICKLLRQSDTLFRLIKIYLINYSPIVNDIIIQTIIYYIVLNNVLSTYGFAKRNDGFSL